MTDDRPLWSRFFAPRRPAPAPAAAFEEAAAPVRPPPTRSPAARAAGTTATFLAEAVEQKRFRTAAFALVQKGRGDEADAVGEQALAEGRYEQALEVFERTGNLRRSAEAGRMAARALLAKGGSRRVAATRLYDAVKSLGAALAQPGTDRVAVLRSLLEVAGDLAGVLGDLGDLKGRGDTHLYRAQLCRMLERSLPGPGAGPGDPRLPGALPDALQGAIAAAREAYHAHVDRNGLKPDDPEGRKVVEKLKILRALESVDG